MTRTGVIVTRLGDTGPQPSSGHFRGEEQRVSVFVARGRLRAWLGGAAAGGGKRAVGVAQNVTLTTTTTVSLAALTTYNDSATRSRRAPSDLSF